MTHPDLPALSSFSELLRTALRAATAPVAAGSRRNAQVAVDRRAARSYDDELLLAALRPSLPRTTHRAAS